MKDGDHNHDGDDYDVGNGNVMNDWDDDSESLAEVEGCHLQGLDENHLLRGCSPL